MMGPSSNLDDYIIVKKSAIPAVICDDVISKIENDQWRKHTWYNKVQDTTYSEDTQELSVLDITIQMQQLLNPFMMQAFNEYVDKVKYGERNSNLSPYFTLSTYSLNACIINGFNNCCI